MPLNFSIFWPFATLCKSCPKALIVPISMATKASVTTVSTLGLMLFMILLLPKLSLYKRVPRGENCSDDQDFAYCQFLQFGRCLTRTRGVTEFLEALLRALLSLG